MEAGVGEWTPQATERTGRPSAAETAVARLYRDHRLDMVRLAKLLVDDLDTAEDVVQEAFAGLHRRWASLAADEAAIGYLRTCVLNQARSVLRRRRTVRRFGSRSDDGASASADAGVLLAEEHREVLAALRTLPTRQREVMVLRYWAGLSEAQIAATLGISVGTVKSSAARARDTLAIRLGGGVS
jgi:RNA polymerase sigma-70 factor (sigma-E family)